MNKKLVKKEKFDRRTNFYDITEDAKELIEERKEWEQQYID